MLVTINFVQVIIIRVVCIYSVVIHVIGFVCCVKIRACIMWIVLINADAVIVSNV